MLVYCYNDVDKVYFGTQEAEQDPKDSNNWLIPSNCTLVQPPAELETHKIVWNGTDWDQIIKADPVVEEQKRLALVVARVSSRLSGSDWASLPDVNLANKQDWLDYRQVLRAMRADPTTVTDPLPEAPPVIWAE
jgi:hypothetical protein